MPEVLRNLLRNLSDDRAEEVWLWLDEDPEAIGKMIDFLVSSRPALQAKCGGTEGAKA